MNLDANLQQILEKAVSLPNYLGKSMKKALLALILFLTAYDAGAQVDQTDYNFLRLPVSVHAAAVGGDNITLIEDDATLIYHNPALLSSVSDKSITLGYMNYMEGVKAASASFSRTVGQRASWAVSAQYVDYGKMTETDENNTDLGTFSAHDISVAGYFSYLLTDRLSGGLAPKMIFSYIGGYNSVGFGVDLGLNYYDSEYEWSISAVAKNLGGQLKAYDEDYEPMPIDFQIGVSKRLTSIPLRLSLTMVDLTHWGYAFLDHAVLGAEFLFSDNFWIGAGYNCRRAHEMKIDSSDGKSSSHGAGLSLGAGLALQRFHVGVAYGKYHVSSSSLLINLGYNL